MKEHKYAKRLLFMTTSIKPQSNLFEMLQQSQQKASISHWQAGQTLDKHSQWFCVVLHLSQIAPELVHQYLAIASQWPLVVISDLDPSEELKNLEAQHFEIDTITEKTIDLEWLRERRLTPEYLTRAIDMAVLKYRLSHSDHVGEWAVSNQQAHVGLMDSMHLALQRQEFVLHYQPQFRVATGEWIGAEALIRWQHPSFGLLPPSAFIKEAETTGLIQVLGLWALHEAARAWNTILIDTGRQICMAVNVSFLQVADANFAEDVFNTLAENNMPHSLLELELTETMMIKDEHITMNNLTQLLQAGVKISLDDFGTGFSSLSHLSDLPISGIKLDRAFVSPIADEGAQSHIASAMIALAKQLNLETTAEGVEDSRCMDKVKQLGCERVQGYYFARPLALEDLLLRADDQFNFGDSAQAFGS